MSDDGDETETTNQFKKRQNFQPNGTICTPMKLLTSLVVCIIGWGWRVSAFPSLSAKVRACGTSVERRHAHMMRMITRQQQVNDPVASIVQVEPTTTTLPHFLSFFSQTYLSEKSRHHQILHLYRKTAFLSSIFLQHMRKKIQFQTVIHDWISKLRRDCSMMTIAVGFWFIGSFLFIMPSPSHASSSSLSSTGSGSSSTLTTIERLLPKTIAGGSTKNMDDIIDRYVNVHMFDDDKFDPVESLYREAYGDARSGSYPQALRAISNSVVGGQLIGPKGLATSRDGYSSERSGMGSLLTMVIRVLQSRLGLTESAALLALALAFVVAGPSAFLFAGMVVGGMSKRNINRVMKKRYGDTYTVDATIRMEEDVEAPDDDEDEEDDNDENDDDDADDSSDNADSDKKK